MTTPASAAKAREIVQRWFDGACTSPIPVEQLRALDDAIAAALDAEWNAACEACAQWHEQRAANLKGHSEEVKRLGAAYPPHMADMMTGRMIAHSSNAAELRALTRQQKETSDG
jgi:hypothetical protein